MTRRGRQGAGNREIGSGRTKKENTVENQRQPGYQSQQRKRRLNPRSHNKVLSISEAGSDYTQPTFFLHTNWADRQKGKWKNISPTFM